MVISILCSLVFLSLALINLAFFPLDDSHELNKKFGKDLLANSIDSDANREELPAYLREDEIKRISRIIRATTYLLPVLIGLSSIGLYAVAFYPHIPQEFGGAMARVAYLDIKKTEVSPETLSTLGRVSDSDPGTPSPSRGEPKAKTNEDVVQCGPVTVYFSGDEFMLIKPQQNPADRVYELRKDAIKSVIWTSDDINE